MVHVVTPFRTDKNLGLAYNEAFKHYSDEDWLCLMDWDAYFLTSDAINHLIRYTELYPKTGIFTAWTGRIHSSNSIQLYKGIVNEDGEIRNHIAIAEYLKQNLYQVAPIHKVISGFLMMIKKETWNEIKFSEDMKCLGVDNEYSQRILDAGKTIFRMEGIYIWHTYRLINGVKDKRHLL